MIDVSQAWSRMKGRWATLRDEPCLFLHASAPGSEADAQVLAAFGRWCEAHPGWACRVGLSGRWLLHSVAAPDMSPADALAHAVQQWAYYLDLDEAGLMRDWLVRQVNVRAAGLLCASPASFIDGLKAHAKSHGVQLTWVGPWWAQGVQACLADLVSAPDRAQGVWTLHLVEPERVTHLDVLMQPGRQARLQRVWSDRALPQGESPQSHCVVLRAPDAIEDARVWDHEAVQPVLNGADACWRLAA